MEFIEINIDIYEYRFTLKKRFESCIARYKGLEEYMEIPDMDVWIKLKEEIINNNITKRMELMQQEYDDEFYDFYEYDDDDDEYDKEEKRMNSRIDRFLCSRRFDRYDR